MSSASDTSGDEGDFSEDEKPLAGATEYTSVRIYTEQDMFPTKIDPLCEIPDWPLATYWPVFLGGFRVESWIESTWSVQISNYFACRGLLTRMMVFPRSRDDIFEKYQQNVLMLDALVYFTSKEDAKRAVATCHHQFYYGYRLNVLPGRFPLYYDPVRTIRFHKVGVDRVVERIVLRSLSKFGDIDFLARYPRDDVVVEFASVEDMLCALRNQKRLRPQEVTGSTQKQRFVEQDVIRDIQDAMRQNYGFMTMQPEMEILVQLFTGQQPNVNTLWNTQRPLKTRFSEKRKYFKKRRLNGSKYSKHRWEAQNVIETNKILQKHGLPPISGQNISGVADQDLVNDAENPEPELIDFSDDQSVVVEAEDELPVITQPHLTGIRCAAHDIQLSVNDILKKRSLANFLAKVRKLVKILTSQPYVNSFNMNKTRKKPFLDGETRWGSAHLMVQRILDEKQFILSMLSTDLLKDFSDKFWTMVDRFVYVTKPLYLLTKRIQEETLICGTMYLYWKECCLELEEMEDPLSAQLYEALQKRQHMWFQNPAFLSAIYVDPRLSDFEPPILSTEQKATAVEHLMKTWKHIRTSQGTEEPTEKPSTSASTNVTNLSRVEKLLMTHRQTRPSDSSDMEKRLKRISLDLSLPLNADVLIFWEKRKREDKELSELALTALQTPCTQVSVERSFNGLSQILTKSRMKLGTVPLEQILFIKSNKDLLESSYLPFEVKKEET